MDLLELGQVVFSKRGRDRGTAYIVVGMFVESGKQYVYLADGSRRPAEKPKRKKTMHIQPTNKIISSDIRINGYLENGGDAGVLNAHLRKSLKKYAMAVSEAGENETV